jgi:hypothetical protein
MDELKTYSNPETARNVEGWPFGSDLRTTAHFYVETDPKRGQRAVRRTIDPRDGTLSKPKKGTYSPRVRIMTGSDGKTYIVSFGCGSFYIMQGNMKFFEEAIYSGDPRFDAMVAIFFSLEQSALELAKS